MIEIVVDDDDDDHDDDDDDLSPCKTIRIFQDPEILERNFRHFAKNFQNRRKVILAPFSSTLILVPTFSALRKLDKRKIYSRIGLCRRCSERERGKKRKGSSFSSSSSSSSVDLRSPENSKKKKGSSFQLTQRNVFSR